MCSTSMETQSEETSSLSIIIPSIFLPRKLPVSHIEEDELHDEFMTLILQGIEEANTHLQIPRTKKLFETWKLLNPSNPNLKKDIETSINSLSPENDMIALYLKEQNAGLILTWDDSRHPLVFSAFQASCTSEDVMSRDGDILVDFPEMSVRIPNSPFLQSSVFAEVMVELMKTSFDKAVPKSRKAGHTFDEIRDVNQPIMVTEWLVNVVGDENSYTDISYPRVRKKIRDDVVLGNGVPIPFRRSGLWTSVKVTLELSLIRELGKDKGIFIYKQILLHVMTLVLSGHNQTASLTTIENDLRVQMMRKISKRIVKLKQYLDMVTSFMEPMGCEDLLSSTEKHIQEEFSKVSTKFDAWTKMISQRNEAKDVIISEEGMKSMVLHELPQSIQSIIDLSKLKNNEGPIHRPDPPPCPERINTSQFPNTSFPDNDHTTDMRLREVEDWILHNLDNFAMRQNCGAIYSLAISYATSAISHYKEDPLQTSRLILCVFKCVQVLHKIAVESNPLLRDHHPGVNVEFQQHLLLPHKEDMVIAGLLDQYFSNATSISRYQSIIDEDYPSYNSFPVRFSQNNNGMIALRERILAQIREDIERKKNEVRRVRTECEVLWKRYNAMTCDTTYNSYRKRYEHASGCSKCSLQHQRAIKLTSVDFYEKLLPEDITRQWAIVFELLIPQEIAVLRDLLHFFKVKILNGETRNTEVICDWIHSDFVSRYNQSQNRSYNMGTTTKSSIQTHGHNKISVEGDEDDFILNNGYNTVYHDPLSMPAGGFPVKCRMQIGNHGSNYQGMQWAVDSTQHTRNQVLARQCECPKPLSILEFKHFGFLRGGHRIQYRNITMSLTSGHLSFNEQEVFALLCQTQWEFERRDGTATGAWVREAHEDLRDPTFTSKLLGIVQAKVEENQKKWSDPFTLCCLTSVALRILEVGNVQGEAALVLRDCRKVALEWIHSLQHLIDRLNSDVKEDEKIKLKTTLAMAALTAAFTFHVSKDHAHLVMETEEDLDIWLTAVTVLQNEVFWNYRPRVEVLKLTSIQMMMLRLAIMTGINLENAIARMAEGNPHCFDNFTRNKYTSADHFTAPWDRIEGKAQLYRCTGVLDKAGSVHAVILDVIFGRFLVDGYPVGRLPEEFVKSGEFQRTFSKTEFSMQPSIKNGRVVFTTASTYHDGFLYCFYMGEHGQVVVEEICQKSGVAQMIPHSLFEGSFPASFVGEHSHWWYPTREEIQFLGKEFTDPKFKEEKYVWNLKEKIVYEKASDRQLIYINSKQFSDMDTILKSVEPTERIHSWVTKEKEVEVELTGLGLRFSLEEGRLHSREFPGFRIDRNQDVGTLPGLQTQLVIVEAIGCDIEPSRIVIVPHSSFAIKERMVHQEVTADIRNLNNPPFFVYTVDPYKKCLEAGKSQAAWLYLAALHGATSSPIPDPLLGMTGTERSFQILHSAKVCSCKGYDKRCQEILKRISQFSPFRVYYPEKLRRQQKITWPVGLSPLCAHEGYYFLVKRLVNDSEILLAMFSGQRTKMERKSSETLAWKHYWRNSGTDNYLTFLQENTPSKPSPDLISRNRETKTGSTGYKVREVGYFCSTWTSNTRTISLRDYLVTASYLRGVFASDICLKTLNINGTLSLASGQLRNAWIYLFRLAKDIGQDQILRHRWKVVLTTLTYHGADTDILMMLHAIAVNPTGFLSLPLPPFSDYECPSAVFSRSEITATIENYQIAFDGSSYETYDEKEAARNRFNAEVRNQVTILTNSVESQWRPREVSSINISNRWQYPRLKIAEAEKGINRVILKLYKSSLLQYFAERFEPVFSSIFEAQRGNPANISELLQLSSDDTILNTTGVINFPMNGDIFLDRIRMEGRLEVMQLAELAYSQEASSVIHAAPHFDTIREFVQSLQQFKVISSNLWLHLIRAVKEPVYGSSLLQKSGLYPRLIPTVLLPVILKPEGNNSLQQIKSLVGAITVFWTLEQKMTRCIRYLNAGDSMRVALERESETEGLKSYCPRLYPEWLLLELELNMTIRPVQYRVAMAMLNPKTEKNSLLQLNMGEGKTSLIVPMLATAIANGKQLCAVTVIKPVFETNVNNLRHTLGGLINRRVYMVPCRRDLDFSLSILDRMQQCLTDCMKRKGVLVTLPEYRLSFQLKGYEFARKGDVAMAKKSLETQAWLNKHVRHVLDESDEILSVKYQLTYTVGDHLFVGGGSLRWEVGQKLLRRLPAAMEFLKTRYGDAAVEFLPNRNASNTSVFPHCRLLQTDKYPELIQILADDVLNGNVVGLPELTGQEKNLLLKFFVDNDITQEEIQQLLSLEFFEGKQNNLDIVLILAGYLRFGVLQAAFVKRWRVNYGVKQNSEKLMAVPFKAKDVASERTEFGHPDMAIVLSLFSYYYSGLSDSQIFQCFQYLSSNSTQNAAGEYQKWIAGVAAEDVHPSVRSYEGINLDDHEQRTIHLFPILKKSMSIIDFWLNLFVFPNECKQFQGKMTCTAWDLVSESQELLTTGFSGTNDSKNTLPATISQNDLDELQETNLKVEGILYLEENTYKHFPNNIKSLGILQQLKNDGIKVLIDPGALVLDLSNEMVAKEWLDVDSTLEAVVYFDGKNQMTVMDRRGNCPFELSPFRERLNVCGVYLDDEHTRGTDIKFPSGSRACVTLGSGLTRDKLVQACMRMRMLGKGHCVTFWASYEVHHKILAMKEGNDADQQMIQEVNDSETIQNVDVLDWVKTNSKQFEEDGMIYWTTSSINYCRKRGATEIFAGSERSDTSHEQLGQLCSEKEIIELTDMYSNARDQELFLNIFPRWFTSAKRTLMEKATPGVVLDHIFDNIHTECQRRVEQIIPHRQHFAQLLDEEQEKELEKEIEQERERELPGKAKPVSHRVSEGLKVSVATGKLQDTRDILPIAEAFSSTAISRETLQPECWGNWTFCTRDFMETVKPDSKDDTLTAFLPPTNWVVRLVYPNPNNGQSVLLVISPYEANRLIQGFRSVKYQSTLHLFTPRSLAKQDTMIEDSSWTLPHQMFGGWCSLLPPLALCAGNLYFENPEEQEEFIKFLCLIPRPRHPDLQAYFDLGYISAANGFVKPEHRSHFGSGLLREGGFLVNPEPLVTQICRSRNESCFPEDCHVRRLVVDGMRSEFKNADSILQ